MILRSACFPVFGWLALIAPCRGAEDGAAIYSRHCASCHGDNGEGVPGEYSKPLHGERSLASLARYIDRNMPDDDPDILDADESLRVAQYIMDAFYSAEARAKRDAPPRAFSRLTQRQYRESVADLVASFGKTSDPEPGTGLRAGYFRSEGSNRKAERVVEREDAAIDFDFGDAAPCDGIPADQFGIEWNGSLLAPVTGWYEFRIVTPNGARLFLNMTTHEDHRRRRDTVAAGRQLPTIDEWVSSGPEPREGHARLFLLGGRSYPLRLDYFKYKEKRGLIRLDWKPPGGVWEVLSSPYLSPHGAQAVEVVAVAFPPEDLSTGFEMGTAVSREWQQAVAAAAMESASRIATRANALADTRDDDPQRVEKLRSFVTEFAARAYRRPLDGETRAMVADQAFEGTDDPLEAVRRALTLILQSPRFLYPETGGAADAHLVATRLALGIWDSVPDAALREAAVTGALDDPEEVARHARRMVNDPRAKAKLMEFFRLWLMLGTDAELVKDPAVFEGFDEALAADLRRSLEWFVEDVVWGAGSDYRRFFLDEGIFLNDRLAGFYRIELPPGDGFRRVASEEMRRAGVISHPYLLARLAHAESTSPIHRGVFLTRHILGGTLRPPPEAIPFDDQKFDPTLTTRQKVEVMTRSADCMSCHDTINPLGFALENFDAVGRFRISEAGKPIDANAEYHSLEGETIQFAGPRDVALHAATSPSARRGFIRQMFQSVAKQSPLVCGADATARLDERFVARDFHVLDLFVEINLLNATHGTAIPSTP
jgi:hypothetical protein